MLLQLSHALQGPLRPAVILHKAISGAWEVSGEEDSTESMYCAPQTSEMKTALS